MRINKTPYPFICASK